VRRRARGGDADARRLLKSIEHAYDMIHADFMHGEHVPIPKDLRFAGLTNLRCEDLQGWHRLLYTIIGSPDSVQCLVICIVDRRAYDKLFGVRQR
jgi:hypothetical protein